MSDQERLIALEREVIDTRKAAARLIVGWANDTQQSPAARSAVAQWFDRSAVAADIVTARLARLIAAALREA